MEVITKGALVVSIRERYDFSGAVSLCSRRDKRRGSHRGKICSASEERVVLEVQWDDPHGGELIETFEVDETDRLVHTSNIRVNRDATTGLPGQPYTYYSIYARE
mmetsp:Transcript_48313/g.100945  ORF Transcript_48313/g.100945 Transcript_48313/m.100945 type:complete len:105 (+) Transcript_48313:509-823(+)